MNILFFGDVVGRSGRDAVLEALPRLKKAHAPALTIVNVDNAAHGFGSTPIICKTMLEAGADVLTAGDHVWDQKELPAYLAQEKRLLRPHNLPGVNAGSGLYLYEVAGKKIAVLHLLGQVFHKEHAHCPFACADEVLKTYGLGRNVAGIFVDFHAEATSEKTAMGIHLDGRVSAVIGSHTHVPTADARILPKGTAYQTDCGMCGDYNSVIGFKPEGPLARFLSKNPKHKLEVATGKGEARATLVRINEKTGLASGIEALYYPFDK